MKKLNKILAAAGATALTLGATIPAHASWDYETLTSGISFSGISTGVLAVAALLAAVYAGIKGARVILGFLRS